MPRQRTYYSRRTHVFPGDFPQRLERFKVESGLSWGGDSPAISEPTPLPYDVGGTRACGPTWLIRRRCLIWPTTWAWATSSPTGGVQRETRHVSARLSWERL